MVVTGLHIGDSEKVMESGPEVGPASAANCAASPSGASASRSTAACRTLIVLREKLAGQQTDPRDSPIEAPSCHFEKSPGRLTLFLFSPSSEDRH
jgi:hypothetical protein